MPCWQELGAIDVDPVVSPLGFVETCWLERDSQCSMPRSGVSQSASRDLARGWRRTSKPRLPKNFVNCSPSTKTRTLKPTIETRSARARGIEESAVGLLVEVFCTLGHKEAAYQPATEG